MERLNVEKAVKTIASVLPKRRPIGHHDASNNEVERKHIEAFLKEGITSNSYTERFQDELRKLTGAEQAIVVSNGTSALHLALMAAGVKPGDEVLVPSLTYAATANAVVHAGAIPNFIDGTLCLNPYKLSCYLERETAPIEEERGRLNIKTLRPVTALIMVHMLGMPCYYTEIRQIADRYGLILIEDAAEAVGTTSNNVACGNMGDVSILSFNHNKIVTTGGGGAILSNDPFIIATAYRLAHQGRIPHPWTVEHDTLGWNYAMPPICAALGIAQLEKLPDILQKKRSLNTKYRDALADVNGLEVVVPLEGSNCWLNTVYVDHAEDRDLLLKGLHDEGIHARALFTPLHTLPFYKDNPRDSMGYTENTVSRAVCLPSGVDLA